MEFKSYDTIMPRQARHLTVALSNPTYWFRVWEDIIIVGESQSVAEQARVEVSLADEDEHADYESEYEKFLERHERGYLFGKCYSVITPEGELGSTHVSQTIWCDADVFDLLKQYGWSLQRLRSECPQPIMWALAVQMDANARDTFHPDTAEAEA